MINGIDSSSLYYRLSQLGMCPPLRSSWSVHRFTVAHCMTKYDNDLRAQEAQKIHSPNHILHGSVVNRVLSELTGEYLIHWIESKIFKF